jgi:hypothetical protein
MTPETALAQLHAFVGRIEHDLDGRRAWVAS